MIRNLSVNEGKNCPIRKAAEAMTRGMAVTIDKADQTVDKASVATGGFLVDVAPNYDGINAAIAPNDAAFENIEAGQLVITIPTYFGERYAVTEVTADGLIQGDYLAMSAGKFVKATTGTAEWIYGGTYADPTGLDMFIIERIAPVTVA